ncbi:MAG: hypothetical protein IKG97_04070 [Lachnospiraceae bacterium]|nr:hypothetical protein [Lachnospiraceae bacterium]
MNNTETERIIDLRILFFRVLKRWRLMLLLLVLGMILGAAFSYLQGRKASGNAKEAIQKYETQKAANEQAVKEAQEALDSYQRYLDGTLIARLDPQNVPTAEARIVVSAVASDETSPNAATIVTNGIRYIAFSIDSSLKADETYAKISALTGTEDRFLREMITLSSNYTAGMIDLTVCYPDLETAQAIRELLTERAGSVSQGLNPEGIASYKVESFNGYTGRTVNNSFNTTKTNFPKNLAALTTNLNNAKTALDGLSYPNVGVKLSGLLKFAVLFGAIFLIAGIVIVALRLLFPHKILSSGDAEQSLGVPVLADYGSLTVKHKGGLDKWILRHLEGKTFGLDTDGHAKVVRVLTENALQNTDKLILLSAAEDEGVEKVTESLVKALPDLKVEAMKSVLNDPARISELKEGSSVMLVEKLEKAQRSAIASELELVKNRRADVKGLILYE